MSTFPKQGFDTPRDIIANLPDGGVINMCPTKEGEAIAQVARKENTYYVCGPQFCYLGLDLGAIMHLEVSEGGAIEVANKIILEQLPDAQIFICQGLADATDTLAGLLAAAGASV